MTSQTVQTAEAVRFTADLGQNKWMASQWQKLLDGAKAAVGDQQGDAATKILKPYIQGMDNFVAEQGYDTTAGAILDYLKSDLYQTYLGLVKLDDTPASKDARRFIQDLLTSPALAKAWQAKVALVAKGQGSGDDLNAFLLAQQPKGYTCSYMQVNAAFQEMRDHNIVYWSGSYRTWLTDNAGGRLGPVVVVATPSAGSSLAQLNLGQDLLTSTAGLVYANGVLSWKTPHPISWDPTNHFDTKCSGALTFSAITQGSPPANAQFSAPGGPPSATAPRHVFTAELTYYDGVGKPTGETATLTGWLDVVSDDDPSIKPGAGAKNSKFPAWVNYLLNGLMVVQMLHSFLGKKPNLKDGMTGEDQAYGDKADGLGDAVETDATANAVVSPFEDASALEGSTLVKSLEAEAEGFGGPTNQDIENAARGDAEFDAARDGAGGVEGEGWGSDLGDLGELAELA